ncbi:MAG: hypothetical protein LBS21_06120 [Clostridiales bacterium]|jgi:hypothetical protein|nr:hypothetical protein [Clostridiales bacterium]
MKLIKCGINEFASKTLNNGFYLFGASQNIRALLDYYPEYKFASRIVSIIDNDVDKHGELFSTMYGDFLIESFDELVCAARKNTVINVLIMVDDAIDILEQIEENTELPNINCYIFNLFAFLDHFNNTPDEITALRSTPPQIPKIIHYMWLGGNPLPERDMKMIETWREFCPDYEIKLWNEDNYDVYKHPFMKQAYKNKAFGFVPDYARLDVVWSHGGIYFDTDVEVIRNLDSLLHNPAFIGLTTMYGVNAGGGFGAAPKNPFVKDMRDIYDGVIFANNTTRSSYSSPLETRAIKKRGYLGGNKFFFTRDVTLYPVEFFAPKSSVYGIPMISSNCYSIHHFNYSWASETLRNERIQSREYYSRHFRNGREDYDF